MHIALYPFMSILNLIANAYDWLYELELGSIFFTAKYTKLSHAVATIAYFAAFA